MKRLALLLGMTLMTAPAHADIISRMSTSVKLDVHAAGTQASRIGSSFSISGSGIDTTDGTTANTVSTGTITSGVYSPGTIAATQDNPGSAFSFSQSYTQADAVPTAAATVGTVPNFSTMTSTSAGTVGDLAGTVTSSHGITGLAAGGAGTSATGQFVTEVVIGH
jgi:hypothetical protein